MKTELLKIAQGLKQGTINDNEAQNPALLVGTGSIRSVIESQLCPKCREKGSLKYKSYLMFSRVCRNDGTYVKLPTHPDYGKQLFMLT